jgi:branched-chain amino acid transport system permease protein
MSLAAPELEAAPADVSSARRTLKSPLRSWGGFAIAMVALAVVAYVVSLDLYYASLAATGLLFAGLAVSWNILAGYCGQFSFGHAVFFGIGAYAVALPKVNLNWGTPAGLLLGALICAMLAALLSWPLFRLRGSFFSIGTLALTEVAFGLAIFFSWTGGPTGVRVPLDKLPFIGQRYWVIAFFIYLALCLAISIFIVRGRLGYQMIAVRDDESTAAASGISPLRTKTIAFVISAALTSIGGGLFVLYVGNLDPASFFSVLEIGAFIPLLALIGGLGTIAGPVIGAFLLEPGETFLRGSLAANQAGIAQGLVGLLLIVSAIYFRQGIWGKAKQLSQQWSRRNRG